MNDAERLARLEQAAARCLERLDAGRPDQARRVLAAAMAGRGAAEPLGPPLSDLELDRAFERAEPVADDVIDADRVAQQAIREVDRELARQLPAPPFATRTMAELLERQGDLEGAQRIRASLGARAPRREPPGGSRRAERAQRIRTLERWLANVRGGE